MSRAECDKETMGDGDLSVAACAIVSFPRRSFASAGVFLGFSMVRIMVGSLRGQTSAPGMMMGRGRPVRVLSFFNARAPFLIHVLSSDLTRAFRAMSSMSSTSAATALPARFFASTLSAHSRSLIRSCTFRRSAVDSSSRALGHCHGVATPTQSPRFRNGCRDAGTRYEAVPELDIDQGAGSLRHSLSPLSIPLSLYVWSKSSRCNGLSKARPRRRFCDKGYGQQGQSRNGEIARRCARDPAQGL